MEPLKPKPAAITYLEGRKITAATAEKYQITVQSKHENILVFPFLDEKGSLQFVKYRKTDFNPAVDKGKSGVKLTASRFCLECTNVTWITRLWFLQKGRLIVYQLQNQE